MIKENIVICDGKCGIKIEYQKHLKYYEIIGWLKFDGWRSLQINKHNFHKTKWLNFCPKCSIENKIK